MHSGKEPTFLGKALALTASAVLLVLGFLFSLALLVVLAVSALILIGYLWWKVSASRDEVRTEACDAEDGRRVIEGEAELVDDSDEPAGRS